MSNQMSEMSYKSITINGNMNKIEKKEEQIEVKKNNYINGYIITDELTIDVSLKLFKELNKKNILQYYLNENIIYFNIPEDEIHRLKRTNKDEYVLTKTTPLLTADYNFIYYILNAEYKTYYKCLKTDALLLNKNKKIVKLLWSDLDDEIVFISYLPPTLHDSIVYSYFNDIDMKFIAGKYRNYYKKNNVLKSNNTIVDDNMNCVDDEGFTLVKNKKKYVKKNQSKQINKIDKFDERFENHFNEQANVNEQTLKQDMEIEYIDYEKRKMDLINLIENYGTTLNKQNNIINRGNDKNNENNENDENEQTLEQTLKQEFQVGQINHIERKELVKQEFEVGQINPIQQNE